MAVNRYWKFIHRFYYIHYYLPTESLPKTPVKPIRPYIIASLYPQPHYPSIGCSQQAAGMVNTEHYTDSKMR